MGTKMTDILLSNFNNLFRLEGDLNSHCQAIAKNRKEIEKLTEAHKICLRDQIKNFLTNEYNLKQHLSLSIFHLSILSIVTSAISHSYLLRILCVWKANCPWSIVTTTCITSSPSLC